MSLVPRPASEGVVAEMGRQGAVNCSLCNLGAVVVVQTAPDGGPPIVDSTLSLSSQSGGEGTCTIPSDSSSATFLMFNAAIPLNGIQPGTYSSSQPNASALFCPSIQLSYTLPSPSPSPDCQGAVGPNCPEGCAEFSCEKIDSGTGEFCPCYPAGPPTVDYTVSGACGSLPAVGSWQVVLTSAVPAVDAGLQTGAAYTVHGSITADLIAGSTDDGGPPEGDHATLSLTF